MIGQTISHYKILGELEKGGMGTVYRAIDPRFEREIAIKVLPSQFQHDSMLRQRFEREGKIIASLEHPAIVPVHDFGEYNGLPFLVMRLMSGGSLKERLKSGALSLKEAARIISHLAPGLDHAHAQGIIHRDLKPSNILFDQHDLPYIADFGLAKLAQSSGLTLKGNLIGTPAYMSPEQANGSDIDRRSDIYALGAILFEMLTGHIPYQGSVK